MGKVFAYARVSTTRQGQKGVSLPEQKDAIARYADRHALEIVRWFVEQETAAHKGRAIFNEMLRLLRRGVAQGVIIHKIDRSVRNLEDWNDIGKLVDADVDVHFATESLDLKTLGGRLAADIQAVVATHYSRNLREEVKKGIYGRLKQGFYPLRAPIGYLDQGAAKAKIPDPVRAPLVKQAFELYASGEVSLPNLAKEMFHRGLTNRAGGKVTVNGWSIVLKNPFYVGMMRIRRSHQTFSGNHEPLIASELFATVQDVLAGKRVDRVKGRLFTYSRLIRCVSCGYSLIAECRKGHTYYRCHDRVFKEPAKCPTTCIREEIIDAAVLGALGRIAFSDEEAQVLKEILTEITKSFAQNRDTMRQNLVLQRERIQQRLSSLADLLIDGTVDKELFAKKRAALLLEQSSVAERLREVAEGFDRGLRLVEKTVELARSASNLYKMATVQRKRELLRNLLSNLSATGKNVEITLSIPFRIIAERQKDEKCGPNRGTCRTWENLLQQLNTYFQHHRAAALG